jgi:hypothetical protein
VQAVAQLDDLPTALTAEAGEFAGDRDGRDGGAFAALGGEVAVAGVQADLGLPGARVAVGSAVGAAWAVLAGPGGLHEQPPGVVVAGLGDVPAVALGAGGVLRGALEITSGMAGPPRLYAALATVGPITRRTLTREPATREGQPPRVHTD